MSDHPDRIQLTAFLDGRLPEADRISIEHHVEHCEECGKAMSELPQDTLSGRLLDIETASEESSFAFDGPKPPSNVESDVPAALRDHPRYRILGLLGKGGMGVVYKAQHRMMDRAVALKVIDSRFIENRQAIERFRTEVKAAARLTHANIVRAYDAEQADHLHFLVMEYVDGISLAELIRRNGPLPVHQVCGVVRKVAQGLQHAFEQGMVHRDIKPQNIMVTLDGRIRILDFGLARLAREREIPVPANGDASSDPMRRTADELTLVGSVLGTPDYIAPEQAMDARQADIRADIYSLGCTCYFLLTGAPPYPTGSAMEKLIAHTKQTPRPISQLRPEVPADIIAIAQRMMERQPQDRYQTPREIAQAMDDYLKGGPTTPAAATHVDYAAVATVNSNRPSFSDPDLLKVDLGAISIDGASVASSVDVPSAAKIPEPPSAVSTDKSKTRGPIVSASKRTSRQPDAANRGLGWKWVMVAPVLTGVAVVCMMAMFPSKDDLPLLARPEVSPPISIAESVVSESQTLPPSPPPSSGKWVDLLQGIDPQANAVAGEWQIRDGELTVGRTKWARMLLPCDVPEQYDFEAAFTRNTGGDSVGLIFVMQGHQATWEIDAWRRSVAGIQNVDGQDCLTNGTGVPDMALTNGERHTIRVRVLKDRVEAYFDGRLLTEYRGDGLNLSLNRSWGLPTMTGIALFAYDSRTTFHSARLRPLVRR